MPRALPILVIVGLAVYSFFDVLKTRPDDFRRFSRTSWLVLVLIPILGATLWFLLGRPRSRASYGPPRIISLRNQQRPQAPDDDPAFLRRLEEEAWRRKRDEARRKAEDSASGDGSGEPPATDGPDTPTPPTEMPPHEGPATGGPGIAPA
jgi:hypothetical protein